MESTSHGEAGAPFSNRWDPQRSEPMQAHGQPSPRHLGQRVGSVLQQKGEEADKAGGTQTRSQPQVSRSFDRETRIFPGAGSELPFTPLSSPPCWPGFPALLLGFPAALNLSRQKIDLRYWLYL